MVAKSVVLVSSLLATSAIAEVSVAPAARPTSARHVVLTADQAAGRDPLQPHEKYVTPSAADVRRLDASLSAALARIACAKPLPEQAAEVRRKYLADGARAVLKRIDTDMTNGEG